MGKLGAILCSMEYFQITSLSSKRHDLSGLKKKKKSKVLNGKQSERSSNPYIGIDPKCLLLIFPLCIIYNASVFLGELYVLYWQLLLIS